MSTELMSRFLEGLSSSRLLANERIEEVIRRPEAPQGDVDGIARFLEASNWLTRFQIDEIREGRGHDLQFAGYRLLDRFPDQLSGTSFKAFHPALNQPVVVRWLNESWLAPADDIPAYIARARAASAISHPGLVNLLDASMAGDMPFLVNEFIEGADLGTLVGDMGALPVPLACDYVRQAAIALQAAHDRGVVHGEITPYRLILSPIVRKPASNGTGQTVVRPAPGATVRLEGLGTVPLRPALGDVAMREGHLLEKMHFHPPERADNGTPTMAGDWYSLGATLYFLLTARPPFPGATAAEVLEQFKQGRPAKADVLRKDITPSVADLLNRLLAKDPSSRPHNGAAIIPALQPGGMNVPPPAAKPADVAYAVPVASATDTRPNTLPGVMASAAAPMADEVHSPLVESLPAGTRDSQVYSPVTGREGGFDDHHADMFNDHHDDEQPKPLRKKEEVKGGYLWLVLGLCLHVTAVALVVMYAFDLGPFAKSVDTQEESKQEQPKETGKKKKGR